MNILLTSVGRRSYMVDYFKDSLKGIGLVHASNSIETFALHLADKWIITPLVKSESYVDFLVNYSIKNNIKAIISFFDSDLLILSRHKQLFKNAGIQLVVSDYQLIKTCNDKWLTHKFLKEHEINSPATFLSIKEVITAINNKKIQYPLIIKPRWGAGSIGIFEADNHIELDIFYKKTQKSITNSYLKYESQDASKENVIIQEKLEGNEYGLDIFNDLNGNLLTCIPKKKLEMRAGETDSAVIISNPELIDLGRNLSAKTKHIGNVDVDCFMVNNKIYILEINCRFGGQYPFAHLAGVNFPKAIIKMLMGQKIDKNLLKANQEQLG